MGTRPKNIFPRTGAIRGLAWFGSETRVKRLLHFFTRLHNYETFRHIYTRQSSDQFDFFELAHGLHEKPFVGVVGQPDNLTSAKESNFRAKRNNFSRLSEKRLSDERR